eukprot:488917_1
MDNAVEVPADGRFSCQSCKVYIDSAEIRATHYRTEWHRYNVKRKCAGMEAVPRDVFEERLAALISSQTAYSSDSSKLECKPCKKLFNSDGAFEQHLKSKKHLKQAEVIQSSEEAKEDESSGDILMSNKMSSTSSEKTHISEKTSIPLKTCLFCCQKFARIQTSLDHMWKAHGFFIAFAKYVTSIEEFLEYLGGRIGVDLSCLQCTKKAAYSSLQAVQHHMTMANHCRLNLDSELDGEGEFDIFYDFSRLDQKDSTPEVSDETSLVVPPSSSKALTDVAPKRRVEEMSSSGELIMSDGSIIGSREYARFYRQNYKLRSTYIRRESRYKQIALPGYAPGGPGALSVKQERVLHQRANKWRMRMGVRNNKITQHHFRAQVNF